MRHGKGGKKVSERRTEREKVHKSRKPEGGMRLGQYPNTVNKKPEI